MPEHIRSLIVILIIAAFIFVLARPLFVGIISDEHYIKRRNAWLIVTLILFLAHNFWLYVLITGIFLLLQQRRENNKVALFVMVAFAAPPIQESISGGGILNYLMELNHMRLVSLVILLPAFLAIRKRSDAIPFGSVTPDKFLLAYLALATILTLRGTTFTDTIRFGVYSFIDIFLPYFVVSRSLRTFGHFKDVFATFIFAGLLMGGVAIVEHAKGWLLYSSLNTVLDATSGLSLYLGRAGSLRASATTGHSIVMGYMMMVTIGFYFFMHNKISSNAIKISIACILGGGLYASLSRGPWVGVVVFFAFIIILSEKPITNLIKFGIFGSIAFTCATLISDKFVDLLPFVGTVDQFNIDYRERLLDMALIVAEKNLLFGSVLYLETPEMRSMIQGQGIIDVVNSYLGVLLSYGLIGLICFTGVFVSTQWGVYSLMRRIKLQSEELFLFGVVVFAVIGSIMVTIYTVSSISFIPVVYWAMIGMGVAYVQMLRTQLYKKIISN
jgi:hypothetical protein